MFEHKMRQRKRGKQHGDGRSKEPADVGFEDSKQQEKTQVSLPPIHGCKQLRRGFKCISLLWLLSIAVKRILRVVFYRP
jgi:hypothetical protein